MTNSLDCDIIRAGLDEKYQNTDILVFDEVDSTNNVLKRMAAEGQTGKEKSERCVAFADVQTGGKGRMGRSFFSPPGSGIYMSILFETSDFSPSDVVTITAAAAVAVCEGISRRCGIETQIKWVNDIFYRGKKICGILAEGVSGVESAGIDRVVLGIGINVFKTVAIPDELKDVMGYVYDDGFDSRISGQVSRNDIAAAVLNELFGYIDDLSARKFIPVYRERSCVTGRRVSIISDGVSREAEAVDIDEDGGLVVCFDDGIREVLRTGEISVRFSV